MSDQNAARAARIARAQGLSTGADQTWQKSEKPIPQPGQNRFEQLSERDEVLDDSIAKDFSPERTNLERDKEFIEFKTQQRQMLEKKIQIQKRIEAMRREYDFIKNLETSDVTYVLQKKREHAAIMVQRTFRRWKAQKLYRERLQGVKAEDEEIVETEADRKRIAESRQLFKEKCEHLLPKHKHNFYDPISDERRLELHAEMQDLLNSEPRDVKEQNLHHIDSIYQQNIADWARDQPNQDRVRAEAHKKVFQVDVMQQYLVNLTQEELVDAQDQQRNANVGGEKRTQQEQVDIQDFAANMAAKRLQMIQSWTDINDFDPVDQDEKSKITREHKDKLNRYRKRKDWEFLTEEDDRDIDGERILAEIKNFKAEHFFNTRFYK